MSCCCVSPAGDLLLDGNRKEEEEEQEEESRRKMDISLLREQYRNTRETQRRHTHVLLLRTVSEELADAVSVIPVTQGLTRREPDGGSPPAATFDPDPTTCGDTWHVHLGLHRRSHPDPSTTNVNTSSRRSSSSDRKLSQDSTLDSACSSREEVRSRGDPDTGSPSRSRGDPDTGSSDRSRGDPDTDPVQVSVSGTLESSEQIPGEGTKGDHPAGSDDSSSPVASITCSPSSSTSSLQEDLKADLSEGRKTSNSALPTGVTSSWRASSKFSAPGLRFTRQLSVGGLGSATGAHQNQNYHPFPNRKTPRISEAARRLGMYSSF